MTVVREAAAESYHAAAASWEADRARIADRSQRRAWLVAGVAMTGCLLAMIALACLAPLKAVQPYLIRVDNGTGIVDVVPAFQGVAQPQELVTRHLLHLYVVARERYVAPLAEADYATVGAMQSPPLNQAWLALWDRNSPGSPLNLYRDGTTVRVQVRSVVFLKRVGGATDLAQVRFLSMTRAGGIGAEVTRNWIATLTYRYGAPSRDDAQRLLNPLGFRITEYQREPETADSAGGPT